jgi:uncharacterized cupredoxin-like copper-binding protein
VTRLLVPAVLAAGLFAGILASGCGDDDDSHEVGGLVHDVHVHLDEWSVEVEPVTLEGAGEITVGGHNHGTLPHQITVIKTDLDAADLPLDRVSVDVEAAGEEVFSIEVPPADGDEGLQVGIADLDAGKYAFICNIPGHYQQGMFASFEVTEAP